MYESYYGFRKRPFAATPDPNCFVPVGNAELALANLTRCIDESRGIGVLTAPAGLGKSLLSRRLARDLSEEWAVVSLTNAAYASASELMQALLFELGHPLARLSENELRLTLTSAARQKRPAYRSVLAIIDEAHELSLEVLEAIRGLTNLVDQNQPLFQFVLSGQLSLDETLALPELDSFRQRIGCQATLDPLTMSDSIQYLAERIHWAGACLDGVMDSAALRLIAHAADGLPRGLNQLADQSLLLGYVQQQSPLGEEIVRLALEDLRQLPMHWNEPARITPSTSVAEATEASNGARSPISQIADTEGFEAVEFGEDFTDESSIPHDAASEVAASCVSDHSVESDHEAPCDSVGDETDPALKTDARLAEDDPRHAPDSEWVAYETVDEELVRDPWTSETPASAHSEIPAADLTISQDPSESDGPAAEETPAAAPTSEELADGSTGTAAKSDEVARPRKATPTPEFDEEIIVDRYALIDAGRPVPEKIVEPRSLPDRFAAAQLRASASPTEIIDRLVPMIDAVLSIDGGPSHTSVDFSEIHEALGRVARPSVPEDGKSLAAADPHEIEDRIGLAVLEACLETRAEISSRMAVEEPDASSPTLEAMNDDELASPTVLPEERIEAPPFRSGDSSPEGNSTPLRDPAMPRQYSLLFSALRKKMGRAA